ncbi:MAG: methyl-accepting chemotaxis protein, partial [bacterium]
GAATREISSNVQMAARATTTLSTNVTSVNKAIDHTSASAGDVWTTASSLSEQSSRLSTEVRKFFSRLQAIAQGQHDKAA